MHLVGLAKRRKLEGTAKRVKVRLAVASRVAVATTPPSSRLTKKNLDSPRSCGLPVMEHTGVCSVRSRVPAETSCAPCLRSTLHGCAEESLAHAERAQHNSVCAEKAARRANRRRNPGYQAGRPPSDAQRQYAKLAQPAAIKGICSDLSSLRSQAERSTVQHAGAFGSRGDWAGSSRTQNGQPGQEWRGCEAPCAGKPQLHAATR
jgi:hypothetical protein